MKPSHVYPSTLLALAASVFAPYGSAQGTPPAAPAKFLRFSNGRIEFPHNNVMNTGRAVTIEGWVRGGQDARGPLFLFTRFLDTRPNAEHKLLFVQRDGSIGALYNGSPWHPDGLRTPEGTFQFDGQWHHVAFIRTNTGTSTSNDQWAITYDGVVKRWGRGPDWIVSPLIQSGNNPTIIGEDFYTPDVTSGYDMKSLRVSSVTRYVPPADFFVGQQLFTPASSWTSDANTALLLDLTRGGATQVADLGPAGQVGTLSPNAPAVGRGPAFYGPSPQAGWALQANTGGTITFPHEAALNTGAEVTIEGWVSAAANATGTFPLFERMSSPTDGKHVSVQQDGSIRVLYSGSPGQMVATPPGVFRKDGQWHHVAFVRRLANGVSGADWQIYYDGSPVLRGSLDTPDGPSGMLLQSGTALWKFDGSNWTQVNGTALATNNPFALNTVNMDEVTLLSPAGTSTYQLQPFSLSGGAWAAAANAGATIPYLYGLPVVGNGLDKLLITYGLEFILTRDKIYEMTRNSATSFATTQVAQFATGANMPDPRSDHSMAYDKHRQIYVLFGGKDASGIYRNDTWTYSSTTRTWSKHYNEDPQFTTFRQAPSPRGYAAMAYHDVGQHIVLHGGSNDPLGNVLGDTWVFHNGWQQVAAGAAAAPAARFRASCAYDGDRQVVVLHGGRLNFFQSTTDTWEWTGSAWRQVTTAAVPPANPGSTVPMAWRRSVCASGGCSITSQIASTVIGSATANGYAIAGARVTPRALYIAPFEPPTQLDSLPSTSVGAGNGSVFALRVLSNSTTVSNEASGVAGSASPAVTGAAATSWASSLTFVGPGCSGNSGVIEVRSRAGNRPQSGSTMRIDYWNLPAVAPGNFGFMIAVLGFGNFTIPYPLSALGMQGCFQYGPITTNLFQVYGSSAPATVTLNIPVSPSVVGLPISTQGAGFEPGINLAGWIISDGAAFTVR
jgi:hypothetical protein